MFEPVGGLERVLAVDGRERRSGGEVDVSVGLYRIVAVEMLRLWTGRRRGGDDLGGESLVLGIF